MKAIFAVAAVLLVIGLSGCTTQSGVATDTIARVYKEGVVCHNWAVQLTNDHPIKDKDGNVDEQKYGVAHDDALIAQLQHYAETGERVKLTWHHEVFRQPCAYADADIITAAAPAAKPATA